MDRTALEVVADADADADRAALALLTPVATTLGIELGSNVAVAAVGVELDGLDAALINHTPTPASRQALVMTPIRQARCIKGNVATPDYLSG